MTKISILNDKILYTAEIVDRPPETNDASCNKLHHILSSRQLYSDCEDFNKYLKNFNANPNDHYLSYLLKFDETFNEFTTLLELLWSIGPVNDEKLKELKTKLRRFCQLTHDSDKKSIKSIIKNILLIIYPDKIGDLVKSINEENKKRN